MAILQEHHKVLTNGVGKCSVPMWSNGTPAGFCDEPAYGREEKGQMRYGDWVQFHKWAPGYVPALACYTHGGPKAPEGTNTLRIEFVYQAENWDRIRTALADFMAATKDVRSAAAVTSPEIIKQIRGQS